MRRPFLAGNWKMNKLSGEAYELAQGLVNNLKDVEGKDILICPTFTALSKVKEVVGGSNIKLGAQNCSYAEKGAYTGEIAPDMLLDTGCEYVILGHSERRSYFKETNETINQKTKLALSAGLKVVLCIGESLEERKAEKTFEVVKTQLEGSLKNIDISDVTIAYEPVWAIGTGLTATPEQAEEVHLFIRNLLGELYGNANEATRILYGGSVNPSTIEGLMQCPNVDGGLIGGASLKVDDFTDIVKKA